MISQGHRVPAAHFLTRKLRLRSIGACSFNPSTFPVQDCFFYSLVFDPVQKTLLADQGEIRVGSKYQAEIPDKLTEGLFPLTL